MTCYMFRLAVIAQIAAVDKGLPYHLPPDIGQAPRRSASADYKNKVDIRETDFILVPREDWMISNLFHLTL